MPYAATERVGGRTNRQGKKQQRGSNECIAVLKDCFSLAHADKNDT